jgi:hypothetical protein
MMTFGVTVSIQVRAAGVNAASQTGGSSTRKKEKQVCFPTLNKLLNAKKIKINKIDIKI